MLAAGALAMIVSPLCPSPHGQFSKSVVAGDRVVCLVDVPNQSSYALWSVPISGGAPVALTPGMADNRDVIAFQVSGDRVAYTADPTVWTQYELYSVPIGGGVAVKLSGSMPFDFDVDDFAFAGSRVVYRRGRNAVGATWQLFSAAATGGASVELSRGQFPGVQRGFQVRGSIVRFAQDPSGSGISTWYAAPVVGGAVWTEIMFEDFERGTKGGFR